MQCIDSRAGRFRKDQKVRPTASTNLDSIATSIEIASPREFVLGYDTILNNIFILPYSKVGTGICERNVPMRRIRYSIVTNPQLGEFADSLKIVG
jgi:hypothetical protein